MIGTNRDLQTMGQVLDHEIHRLQQLAADPSAPSWIHRRLTLMCRQRISVCAALANRRIEASNKVVTFSRWVSGYGVLESFDAEPNRVAAAGD